MSKNMTKRGITNKRRFRLFLLWVSSFLIILGYLLFLYLSDAIEFRDLMPAITTINLIYSPIIGAMTFFFIKNPEFLKENKRDKNLPSYFVYGSSIICNLIIFILLFPVVNGTGNLEDAISNISNTYQVFSWFSGAVLGYFFAVRL